MKKIAFRNIFLIWLAWTLIVIGFQALATARFQPQWPDRSQLWTEKETGAKYQLGKPYLLEPFMNDQVAWDSEFYLGIATGGYDDPQVTHLTPFGTTTYVFDHMILSSGGSYSGDAMSLSYAFFPFYPWTIWLVAQPLKVFGMNPIATSTLAGVIVSALGTLLGMLSLYELTRDSLGEDGAMRAAFYLIIFPTGFFLVQIYTEGLFVGLAFACLAMLKRGRWLPAALLGALATLTRAVGVALVIPMAITWFRTGDWLDIDLEWRQAYYLWTHTWKTVFISIRKFFRKNSSADPDWSWIRTEFVPVKIFLISFGKMLLAFAPLITFLIWKFSYLGFAFDYVETNFFGRGFLDFGYAFYSWSQAIRSMFIGVPERTAYFFIECIGLVIGSVTCILCIKHEPELAWFSLAVFLISWGSGPTQGIIRYILAAPAVFVMLARWGKNPVFDRAWTIASLLLMGLLATLYAFNMWVA